MTSRLERLYEQYTEKVEEFGSPERNMAERRRMLKQLRDMEQEIDKMYNLEGIKNEKRRKCNLW